MESVKKWKEKALRLAKRVNDDTLIKLSCAVNCWIF
jgi:hypothetical protein